MHDRGPLSVGKAFSLLMREYEPLPYLGDLMFWWLLQRLIDAPQPLLIISDNLDEWPQRQLALTERGRDLLGRCNA
ncbi:hypothetical protein [Halomonas sp. BC04]|uniref:hypothetical protein n=1 Tax=Halomonas sp. BC04 TaxID=1403540 RepID=UPI0012DED3B2|nr:hypothetical protein [Halomonas sp. BC04]